MLCVETIILKKVNEVYLNVQCTVAQGMELKEYFSCFIPNHRWHPLVKDKLWDGVISFFKPRERSLPIGLLPDFARFCKKFNYQYKFDFDVETLSNDIQQQDLDKFYEQIFQKVKDKFFLKDSGTRDYQNTVVLSSIKNKRGVFEVGTGGGKSLSIYALIRFLKAMNKKILLIVPNVGLVEQMYSDFDLYGWEGMHTVVQKLYARYSYSFDINNVKPVLISTWQSLIGKKPSFFKDFDAVIIDETHLAKCTSIQELMKMCVKAEYRIGLTGTLPDEKADLYTIHGFLGPTLFSIRSGELIDRGILSNITIANLILKYPVDVIKECHGRGYNFEVDYIMKYEPRNKALDFIIDHTPENQNTLILVSRIEKHLKPVIEHLEKKYPDKEVHVIYGQTEALVRERIRSLIEKKTNLIIVATYQTLSTGFNVKNLHQIVFFSSYKAKIKILQSVGRGLRTHESKDQLIVFDVVDDLTYTTNGVVYFNYLVEHFFKRKSYYDNQGFTYLNKIIRL